ncbi:unnamed protein product [Ectocarpus sp. 12 AP-2014]
MYLSNPTGKAPDGKKCNAHGDVTHHAVRLKLDGDKKSGFIVENDKNMGVFSVNTQGNTRMGAAKVADIVPGRHASFSHHAQHGIERCAISQTDRGRTILNCSADQETSFTSGNTGVACVKGVGFDVLNTGRDAYRTHFNHGGNNYISCDRNGGTYFRAGKGGARAHINKHA